MARDFDGVDDDINCGSAAGLDNPTSFTICAWIFADSMGEAGGARIVNKEDVGQATKEYRVGGTNQLFTFISRDTSSASATSAVDAMTTGEWNFVAVTYDETDGPRLFRGTLTGAVAEVSYDSQTVGSGTTTSEAAGNFVIGNNQLGSRTFDGRIAEVFFWHRRLLVAELEFVRVGATLFPSDLKGYWALEGEESPEPDRSGNGNNGTVTGAVAIAHPDIVKRRRRLTVGVGW